MDTEMIKELAVSVNNVAISTAKPYQEQIAKLKARLAEQAEEIKGLKENLIEYGRHAAGCSQEYAKKYRCRCGWWDAVEKILKCDTP